MALRINLEIGHEASLRTKRTPEGFTHDWKIFVRGSDGADIHYYIEKVVFHLHETFQKPKRVVKEPPYAVKESGYAGFNLPIDIYLRNSGEPKKIKFNYDLHLQPSGPPISKVQKEKYVFNSVPEDFKQKLLRGGGVVTSSPQESTESKSVLYEEKNQLISKPKFSGADAPQRKPKLEPHMSNSFQDLFGPPITKMTKMPESKVPPHKDNKSGIKPDKEKVSDKVKSKHSPHKEKEKERDRDKSEKKVKEEKKKDKEKRDKDRERNKEKSFRKEKSPKPRSPSPKHSSPKSSSPVPPPSTPSTPAGKHREKDSKGDKEKKEKLDKDEKKIKKEKKDKEQNKDKDKHRDSSKGDHKLKETKAKESVPFSKESEVLAQSPAPMPPSQVKQEKKDKPKIEDKTKLDKIEKPEDKKHKHKKKDKNKKERREKEEKSHKMSKNVEKEKTNTSPSFSSIMSNSANGNELAAEKMNLFGASPKMETSSVTSSPKENDKSKPLNKLFSTFVDAESDSSRSSGEPSPPPEDNTREKSKQSDKSNERDSDQRKRKSSSDAEPPPEKVVRDGESSNDSSDEEEAVIKEDEAVSNNDHSDEEEEEEEEVDEHMAALRNIQHKIMTMKDNDGLQKVVQLIAGTGKYEISASTFDFDLCLLDMETIKQLEEYLSNMS
ncbi:hypothetical protein WA026_016601 [Henosepilachna vigintioctopunctata]|uniref:YEATS domain-containing protein n=1 Tax=Henosepilachna vigintioctopunctata TaxID=420089 RepID=A0AAW1VAV0_9CUCU